MPRPIPSALRVAAVGLLVLAPVLYVLSAGPAYRLAVTHRTVSALDRIYAPLWWLESKNPDGFGRFFIWYVEEPIIIDEDERALPNN